jgi:hypothetical protein
VSNRISPVFFGNALSCRLRSVYIFGGDANGPVWIAVRNREKPGKNRVRKCLKTAMNTAMNTAVNRREIVKRFSVRKKEKRALNSFHIRFAASRLDTAGGIAAPESPL